MKQMQFEGLSNGCNGVQSADMDGDVQFALGCVHHPKLAEILRILADPPNRLDLEPRYSERYWDQSWWAIW